MKQIYSPLKTLAFAAMAMVATTATAQASFKGTFTELQQMFNFPVSTMSDGNAGNLAGHPLDFQLFTLSATDKAKTATRMWEAKVKKAQEGGDSVEVTSISLRIYKNSSVTLRANLEGVKVTKLVFTSQDSSATSKTSVRNFTASVGTYDATTGTWTGDAKEVTFTATNGNVFTVAIEAEIAEDKTTSIAAATAPAVLAGTTPVYNLQGQKVATYATFLTLPKGIYVVNGQKVVR